VDVNLDFMADETVRVNITAKRSALALIDRVARAAGEDRSQFLIRAALERATRTAAQATASPSRGRPPARARAAAGKGKSSRR
jgi:hypothetical protein